MLIDATPWMNLDGIALTDRRYWGCFMGARALESDENALEPEKDDGCTTLRVY